MAGFGTALTVMCVAGGIASAQIDVHASVGGGPPPAVSDTHSLVADVLPPHEPPTLRSAATFESRVGDASLTATRLVSHGPHKGRVRLDLGGWSVDALLRPMRDDGAGRFALAGTLADEPLSQVVVTVEGGVLRASVVSPTRGSFRIRTGDAGYELVSVDASAALGCGRPHEREDRSPTPRFQQLGSAPVALRSGDCIESGARIDVLVVYTPGAVTLAGGQPGLDALIQAGIDETNLAMTNSLLSTQMNVVWTQEVAYTTSGNFSTDLARLAANDDGHMDEVHQLRDDFKADLVCLISEPGNVCGIAYISVLSGATPNEDLGFSVVNANCVTAPTSAMAHELGHNLGIRHDWNTFACNNGARRYAKAYVEPGETFQTVVGATAAPRILQYSNPTVEIGGILAGVGYDLPNPADAAKTIFETSAVVAGYRSRDCNVNGVCDEDDIINGFSLDCNLNGYPDECEIDFNHNGVPDECDITLGTSLDADSDGVPDETELARIYVDQNATGAESGAGWTDARTDLQEVLAIAEASGDVSEVWVAGGTYIPSDQGHRDRPFDIPPGVSMYGGFAGTEATLDERDIAGNPTVLSGDLRGDDATDMAGRADNSLHVVYHWQAGTVDFDGFTVTGGLAELPPNCNLDNYGGGMFTFGTDITIRNCLFTENAGTYGGALAVVQNSTAKIIDCDFISNDAIGTQQSASGAAMYFSNGPLPGSDPVVINCRVIGNRSVGSSAVVNIGGLPSYDNCLFLGNRAYWLGAAMSNSSSSGSDATIRGCTFVDNETQYSIYSGGIENYKSDPVITNTVLWNNRNGGGASEQAQISNVVSVPVINYSIVDGWTGAMGGVGNSGADPLFADELGADLIAGTIDDDLRLSDSSPAIDAGDSAALPADTYDLDGDLDTAESLPVDLDGESRLTDDASGDTGVGPVAYLDLGVYERAGSLACSEADVTTTGAPIGDPGYGVPDGQVTGADINYYVNAWLAGDLAVADLTTTGAPIGDPGYGAPDGQVTGADINYYVNIWLVNCP